MPCPKVEIAGLNAGDRLAFWEIIRLPTTILGNKLAAGCLSDGVLGNDWSPQGPLGLNANTFGTMVAGKYQLGCPAVILGNNGPK